MVTSKPPEMFDRDREWEQLAAFTMSEAAGARLGVVSGRRRQGKTYLLRALCEATGGFYFAADEATAGESLRRLGAALANHQQAPAPFEFTDWHAAVDTLLALGRSGPIPIVIDEFPYLVKSSPSLPSVVQNALAPLRTERDQSRARILLCGSAMSFMSRLLGADAPLRGRSGLNLIVQTLDHQLAARFWEIDDPRLAMRVHAVVGGTPAYRREFTSGDTPDGPADFDDWVLRTVLNPASPLFREARYLLADELETHDMATFHSVLAAIASGNTMRGAIANYLGRKSSDLSHPLTVLEDVGLITRESDAFRRNRTTFRINEPLIAFYHAVMRPIWSDLEHTRNPEALWQRSQRRFVGNVLGPHFEHLCRWWTRYLSPADLFDLPPYDVSAGTVNDATQKSTYEVDVVATGLTDDDRTPLIGIGEVKWGEVMDMGHLDRLRHIQGLLSAQGRHGAESAKLVCYGAAGFSDALRRAAEASDRIELVDVADLYG